VTVTFVTAVRVTTDPLNCTWCEVARYVCYRFMQARFTAVVVLVILHRVSEVCGLTELKDMLP
jgi:hypothetical protein